MRERDPFGRRAIYLRHLSLTHFRNYVHQELELPPGLLVFVGNNAQGKSNLLEAAYLLATTRSLRATTDREMVGWTAAQEPLPYSRVAGTATAAEGDVRVELVIQTARSESIPGEEEPWPEEPEPADLSVRTLRKVFKVNEVPRRAAEVVGRVKAVLFGPEEVETIGGPPSLRRRSLDLAASQVDPAYVRALQRYTQVAAQRNALLRAIREGHASSSQLAVWDGQLVETGSLILLQRLALVRALQESVQQAYVALSGEGKPLTLSYESTVPVLRREEERASVQEAFHRALERSRPREVLLGTTLVGPHRDDLRFFEGKVDMGVYASRGQQRSLALAVKLAEATYMRDLSGQAPLLLLDDVLSELDASHRAGLLRACAAMEQVWLTTADEKQLPPLAAERPMALYRVERGTVKVGTSLL
ncbi:MAG: DNA replication/repair protein RecF [Chloroflexi bacterium]|nr:DNA replication/repair protein RecF [Chloroflexota bacterium]